jgi:uncharacterized SAM-binding protein YcdF (DUF218 family)
MIEWAMASAPATRLDWRKALLLPAVALGGIIMGILMFATVMANEIYEYQDTVDGVHLPEVDAIVVLAGGRGRITSAGDLWYHYHTVAQAGLIGSKPGPVLYVSGMGHQSNWASFAKQVRSGVVGVMHPEDVVLETESSNTEENAQWLVKTVKQRGWSKILLTTSSYHMKRARMMLEKTFHAEKIPITIDTLSIYQDPFEPSEWRSSLLGVRVTLTEYMKLIFYKYFWTPDNA